MRNAFYIAGLIVTTVGLYTVVNSVEQPGGGMFNAGVLLVIRGQTAFIQGTQQ